MPKCQFWPINVVFIQQICQGEMWPCKELLVFFFYPWASEASSSPKGNWHLMGLTTSSAYYIKSTTFCAKFFFNPWCLPILWLNFVFVTKICARQFSPHGDCQTCGLALIPDQNLRKTFITRWWWPNLWLNFDFWPKFAHDIFHPMVMAKPVA